mgnify:CR=1 FL=1
MTDNTLKTNNTQQVEPEFRPLTEEEAEMLLEKTKNWKEPEYDDYDAITLTKQAVMWDSRQL